MFKSIAIALMVAQIPLVAPRPYNHKKQAREDPTIYIVYDESPQSDMLISEIKRDWTKYGEAGKRVADVYSLTPINRFVYIKYDDYDGLRKHRIKNDLINYPAYRIGNVGDIIEFPRTAFITPSFPLLTLLALVEKDVNLGYNISQWEFTCRQMRLSYKRSLEHDAYNYVTYEIGLEYDEVRELYQDGGLYDKDGDYLWFNLPKFYRDFPQYNKLRKVEQPKYPPKPEVRMPWE